MSLQNATFFRSLKWIQGTTPCPPYTNVDDTNVKNQTRRPALNLKGLSLMQDPTLKFQGQGDTHRVTMKSKARLHTQSLLSAKLPVQHMDLPFQVLANSL